MKKTALLLVSVLCLSLSSTAFADIPRIVSAEKAGDIVTLGEYKGLELVKEVEPVTDEMIQQEIDSALETNKTDVGEGPVEEGDTATIDYIGKKDGEAFDGGTADGYPLVIGSGTFIPGFEEQVVGMKKGETKDINVTFPEDYREESLAGAEVVFTVTVQSISRASDLTDEWVKANTEQETVDEYREAVKAQLEEQKSQEADTLLEQNAFAQVMEGCEFGEFPQEDVDFGKNYMIDYITQFATMYGMEYEDFVSAQGYTLEQFEEQCEASGRELAKQNYLVQAILEAEDTVVTDEEAEEMVKEAMEAYGYATMDELKESMGEEQFNMEVSFRKVLGIIIDNAKITEKTVSDAEETTEEATEAAGEAATEESTEETAEAATEAEAEAATEAETVETTEDAAVEETGAAE